MSKRTKVSPPMSNVGMEAYPYKYMEVKNEASPIPANVYKSQTVFEVELRETGVTPDTEITRSFESYIHKPEGFSGGEANIRLASVQVESYFQSQLYVTPFRFEIRGAKVANSVNTTYYVDPNTNTIIHYNNNLTDCIIIPSASAADIRNLAEFTITAFDDYFKGDLTLINGESESSALGKKIILTYQTTPTTATPKTTFCIVLNWEITHLQTVNRV